MLRIIYQDKDYVAVDKPSGLLVHRTALTTERENCMALLRDQLGQWVYPVHRLDRATSGVLIFALSSEAASRLAGAFQEKSVRKTYHAVVRGYTHERGEIDHPLREAKDKEAVPAQSSYERVSTIELPHAVGRYPTARYSLVRVRTHTGRQHQVRKHLSHISHPIIGDTVYGDGRHNRFFRDHFGIHRLLLVATEVTFRNPYTGIEETLRVDLPPEVDFLGLT